jgi:hypothetical protein
MAIFLILEPPPGNPVLNISTVNNFSSVMRVQFEPPLLTSVHRRSRYSGEDMDFYFEIKTHLSIRAMGVMEQSFN